MIGWRDDRGIDGRIDEGIDVRMMEGSIEGSMKE
jgi:hypothetical protein